MNHFKKSTRSPLLSAIRKTFGLFIESQKPGSAPLEELIQESVETKLLPRREFLGTTAKAGLLVGMGSMLGTLRKASGFGWQEEAGKLRPSIAILGAGIAGLNCAYQLKKAGITSTIYEGSSNAGGRILTKSDFIAPGTYTECGGEFIDTGHTTMRNLATEFSLPLADTFVKSEEAYERDSFYIDGQFRTEEEVMHAFAPFAKQIAADIQSLPNEFGFNNHTPAVLKLDQLSISAYLDSIGMPASGFLRKGIEGAYNTEYGLETDQQTSINFLYLFTINPGNAGFKIFGLSDERFKVVGGNQQITNALYNNLQSQVQLGHALSKISKNNSGVYKLDFANGNSAQADIVVMTIPFSVLRNIDTGGLNLPSWKTNAIQNLGYGTNAKLIMGFNSRVWRQYAYSGYIFTNGTPQNPSNFIQTGWDNTWMQPGTAGGFTAFAGGNQGAALSLAQTNTFLAQLDTMWPGCNAAYNGTAKLMHWPTNPWSLGSYSCWKVGQITTISGAEKLPVDNLFFAGEHTSTLNQGFMEGGAETGGAVARTISKMVLTGKKAAA